MNKQISAYSWQIPRYPLLMVHGMGFRDRKRINYWGRIPKVLERKGCYIFYGGQDSNASIETNARVLADKIRVVLQETGADKLNIIAHSKGGLDVRAAICDYHLEEYIASVTTINAPHHGSKTVDLLLKFPDWVVRIAGACTDVVFRVLGDKEPDSYQVFHSLTTRKAEEFNWTHPDAPNVYYQSFAFVMRHPFGDIFLWFPSLVVWLVEGENDGLLTPTAVQWGEFQGIIRSNSGRGISHCDEVDMRRHRLTRKQGEGVSDIVDFYVDVVRKLAERGF